LIPFFISPLIFTSKPFVSVSSFIIFCFTILIVIFIKSVSEKAHVSAVNAIATKKNSTVTTQKGIATRKNTDALLENGIATGKNANVSAKNRNVSWKNPIVTTEN
jgi:hypothetical protein